MCGFTKHIKNLKHKEDSFSNENSYKRQDKKPLRNCGNAHLPIVERK